jgi:hypothetical protein
VRHALIIAAAVLAACGLLAAGSALASAAPHRGERAPECHQVQLIAPSGRSAWVAFCGSGPGRESPVQDWISGDPKLIMDGTRALSPAACPKANPCVIIADSTPPS